MHKIHSELIENVSWYRAWHQNDHTTAIHFVTLLFYAIAITSGLLLNITNLQDTNMAASAISSTRSNADNARDTDSLVKAQRAWKEGGKTEEGTKALVVVAKERKSQILKALEDKEYGKIPAIGLPESVVSDLPEELDGLIEKQIEYAGTFIAMHADDPENDKSLRKEFLAEVGIEKKNYNVHFLNGTTNLMGGEKIKVKGYQLDNSLILQGTDAASVEIIAQAVSSNPENTTGAIKYTSILFNFTDDTSQPFTVADMQNRMYGAANTSVSGFIKESSFGKASITGTAHGWYTIPYSKSQCGTNLLDISYAAIAAAKAAGVDTSGRILFAFPYTSSCAWAGASSQGGTLNWSFTNGYTDLWVVGHEIGHSFGTSHAGTYSCGSTSVAPYTNCSWSEYGDPFDIMGNSKRNNQFNAAQKTNLKWFAASNIQTVTQSGTYKIAPLEAATNAVQTLRIAKPDSASYTPAGVYNGAPAVEYYYIDYRQLVGADSNIPAQIAAGAMVHAWNDASYLWPTRLLDMTPGDGDFTNGALSDGATFTDAANGITVTQVSHDATGVTLAITVPGALACTPAAPTVSISPASVSVATGMTASYSLTVKNNDSSTCPTATYTTSMSLPADISGNASPASLSVAPGGTSATTLFVSGTSAGSYTVSVSVSDPAIPMHTGSGSAVLTLTAPVVDITPPIVSVVSPTNGSQLSGANTNISASATDNRGVSKVEFVIDGKLVSTDTLVPYAYKWNIRKVSPGAHTITARAYDAAGNKSESTVSVTK